MLKYTNSIFANHFGGADKITPTEFASLCKFIHSICGIKITSGKEYLIIHRLTDLYKECNCDSWNDFLKKLHSDTSGLLKEKLISAISTNETSFFRDSHPFQVIRSVIFPSLADKLKNSRGHKKFRIWCAASSTGQEPYSLAMLFRQYLSSPAGRSINPSSIEIVATDISSRVLEIARRGVYSDMEYSRGLPSDCYKYFNKSGSQWEIVPEIKSMVRFKKLNLMNSFSTLGNFDFVLCRNVLIYFDYETKINIVNRISELMEERSYLLLGASEGIVGQTDSFVAEHHGKVILYKKDTTKASEIRKVCSCMKSGVQERILQSC